MRAANMSILWIYYYFSPWEVRSTAVAESYLHFRSAFCINFPIQLVSTVACWNYTRHRVFSPLLLTQPLLYSFFTQRFSHISFRAFLGLVHSIQGVRWNSEKLLVGFSSTRLSSLVPALSIQFKSPLQMSKAPIQTTSPIVNGMQSFLAHPKSLEKSRSPRSKPN